MKALVIIFSLVCICQADIDNDKPEMDHSRGSGYVHRKPTKPSQNGHKVEWDPNGYLFFCLAMGRIGNQMEHFLGSLDFAKKINRTLVLPPLRTYRNVRFTEWFEFEPLLEYHKVILAADFMEYLAPIHWPPDKRVGYCFGPYGGDFACTLKEGNPFKPFWDGLEVDFVRYDFLDYAYHEPDKFATRYPGSRYPVLALRGAPAPFPMNPDHWDLQRHLVFSDRVTSEADKYISENFPGEVFVGIHLRNGADWEHACKSIPSVKSYMASPQCLHGTKDLVNKMMCLPSSEVILSLLKNVVLYTKATVVFVATDQNPMIAEITEHLKKQKIRVYHMDPYLAMVDQAILIQSDHFIGNCISSFSSFVTRARRIIGKPTAFFGFD